MIKNNDLNSIFSDMKKLYNENIHPTLEERTNILKILKKSIIDNEQDIYKSLNEDYGYRNEFDTFISDILSSVSSINYSIKNLKKWMKPSKRHSGIMLMSSTVKVHYQPLGVVGIITPWNFPVFLSLGPAAQALAAGNRVMIKMSEFTPNINKVIKKIVEPISEHIQIIEGESEVGVAFSNLPFNHLIFTGSSVVGKHVAKAAANNLTPITLELGGKSPTIIDKNVNLDNAIDAILLGKTINSGQICVAPDYVFVPESMKNKFIDRYLSKYSEYYLKEGLENKQTHIISERQHKRLNKLLKDAEEKGANITKINKDVNNSKLMYPHILTELTEEMDISKEEIFGSILPIITYSNINEVFKYINKKEKPLALYIMSKDNAFINNVLMNTHSGGVSINDSVMHVVADDAPFGGIGNSGIGHYHGHEGFLTFSNARTVLHSKSWIPKNKIILQNRDRILNILRRFLLK